MKRAKSSNLPGVALVMGLCLPFFGAAAPASAGVIAHGIAEIALEPAGIVWQPAGDLALELTVSGPGGLVHQQGEPGAAISFALYDAAGFPLPDGSYTYELRAQVRSAGDATSRPSERVQAGYFSVVDGSFVIPAEDPIHSTTPVSNPDKDVIVTDDLIVIGNLCAGGDCKEDEVFATTPLLLKDENLRIHFKDTSTGSYPTNDWQITVNDAGSGGADRFSIEDLTGGTTPFTIEADADSNSLYVDDAGRVGIGTATPSAALDVIGAGEIDGKLTVTGSDGSKAVHVQRSDGTARILVEENTTTSGNYELLTLSKPNNGAPIIRFYSSTNSWHVTGGQIFSINDPADSAVELYLDAAGNLTITGSLTTNAFARYPDYVFAPDYRLMPLDEVAAFVAENGHLPKIPSAADVEENGGVDVSELQIGLLEKVEELTLYTVEQHRTIAAQEAVIRQLEERLAALERRVQGEP